jgi:uncharacterized protein (TIGR00725 family)
LPTHAEKTMLIAVIGGGLLVSPEALRLAEEVGRELARKGVGVVCGGLGGVMEAACRGASEEGGLTIGILPTSRAEDANPYVHVPIPTGLGHARNILVVRSARAVIAVDGGYGTLTEIAHALVEGTPVVALQSWEIAIDGRRDEAVHRAATAQEAVELAIKLARERG